MLHALKLTSIIIFFVWIKVTQFSSEEVWLQFVVAWPFFFYL
jgi:hypothetical protein